MAFNFYYDDQGAGGVFARKVVHNGVPQEDITYAVATTYAQVKEALRVLYSEPVPGTVLAADASQYPRALHLTSPDGTLWRFWIDDLGVNHIDEVV